MKRFRLGAAVCGCLLLAACGGTSARQASITRATALRLASESDSVAAALRRGDSCGAARQARALRSHVSSAIATGSIPRSLAAATRNTSVRVAAAITCVPATGPPTPPAVTTCADSRGKHGKGRGANERKHEGDRQETDHQRKGCN